MKNAENARLILGSLVGGIISLMVFSFSMVMVVLNSAASSLSPRVIPGLISSGPSYKANLLRGFFPDVLTPDFEGSLEERMAKLEPILSDQSGWVIIGSSFGGLMQPS